MTMPPARIATSDVACGFAGVSSAGGGTERALSAADGTSRNAMPAPSNSAEKISAGRKKSDDCGVSRLLKGGSDETDDRMRHARLFQRGNLVGRKFHVHGCESIVEMV